jgi:hypothetical protein
LGEHPFEMNERTKVWLSFVFLGAVVSAKAAEPLPSLKLSRDRSKPFLYDGLPERYWAKPIIVVSPAEFKIENSSFESQNVWVGGSAILNEFFFPLSLKEVGRSSSSAAELELVTNELISHLLLARTPLAKIPLRPLPLDVK